MTSYRSEREIFLSNIETLIKKIKGESIHLNPENRTFELKQVFPQNTGNWEMTVNFTSRTEIAVRFHQHYTPRSMDLVFSTFSTAEQWFKIQVRKGIEYIEQSNTRYKKHQNSSIPISALAEPKGPKLPDHLKNRLRRTI